MGKLILKKADEKKVRKIAMDYADDKFDGKVYREKMDALLEEIAGGESVPQALTDRVKEIINEMHQERQFVFAMPGDYQEQLKKLAIARLNRKIKDEEYTREVFAIVEHIAKNHDVNIEIVKAETNRVLEEIGVALSPSPDPTPVSENATATVETVEEPEFYLPVHSITVFDIGENELHVAIGGSNGDEEDDRVTTVIRPLNGQKSPTWEYYDQNGLSMGVVSAGDKPFIVSMGKPIPNN